MNLIQKTTNLNGLLKSTSYVSAYPSTSVFSLVVAEKAVREENPKYFLNVNSMYSLVTNGTGFIRAVSGVTIKSQIRYVHTDVKIPDYTKRRRVSTRDPTVPAKETADQRRAFTYLNTGGALLFSALMVKTAVIKGVLYFHWNQDVAALGTSEIDLQTLTEGKSITFKWQGKPLFIKHRTQAEIDDVRNVPLENLRDPEPDEKRVKDPKFLICLGVCTHLGCVPLHNKGENLGGFFCPCHGSHYDASGRVTNGPAPRNLEVPDYYFKDSSTIVVG